MSSTFVKVYLVFYSFWLFSCITMVVHSYHIRETSKDILGDLTAVQSGILNEDSLPQCNCKEIYDSGFHASGLYKINLNDCKGEFTVFCDMTLQDGGWMIIQRRVNNTISFNLNKKEYQVGFGKFNSNFWLGLEKIKRLTDHNGATYELYIGFESFFPGTYQFRWVKYGSFGLGKAVDDYKLYISQFDASSTAGDALSAHNGEKFSTPDNDVDSYVGINCAQVYSSGWWYHNCHDSHLNGIYYDYGFHLTSRDDGIIWSTWLGNVISLKTVVMAIRPAKKYEIYL